MKTLLLFLFCSSAFSIDYKGGDIRANDSKWMQVNLFRGDEQRGGFRKFDDTYLELEFGGRSGIVDYYGYVDFLDVFDDEKNSEQNGFDNHFAKFNVRFSFDAMFKKDLALGPIKEWYLATEMMSLDNGAFGGGRFFWFGLGTDTEIPWLGLVGLNFQTRYFAENFGASNEKKFDGYVLHINWFKPLTFFENKSFLAFQGYIDYEFGSDIEEDFRTTTAFQSYFGVWYHLKNYAIGYGAKLYRNMNNFRHKDTLGSGGPVINSTGLGHYFNVTYKF